MAQEPLPTHRVVANLGRALAVTPLDGGAPERAMPLRNLPLIVCGDRVRVERDEAGAVRATALAQRATVLERADHRGRFKPLAANLTHLGIVAADPPGLETLLIDQFCIAAACTGLEPLVVFNKCDLLDEPGGARVDGLLADYRSAGYAAVAIDATTDAGTDPLREALVGTAAALVGASGVGKSSIVQRLLPEREIRVGAVSAATGLGSHTTSVTFWYELPDGGSIVDSPGVRQYSVSELSAADVRGGMRDVATIAEGCRFNDCSHAVEPDCAVQAALAAGELPAWRYENFLKLSLGE